MQQCNGNQSGKNGKISITMIIVSSTSIIIISLGEFYLFLFSCKVSLCIMLIGVDSKILGSLRNHDDDGNKNVTNLHI